jgi:hypothetical protein
LYWVAYAVIFISCIPNIDYIFDFASFSLRIYAFGRVKKGDELVWSYVTRSQSTSLRQKDLSPYGFQCSCRICATGGYDAKTEVMWDSMLRRTYMYARNVMKDLLKEDLGDKPFHAKSPAEKEIRLVDYRTYLSRLEEIQRESDSYGNEGELYILCLLHELYKRVGNETRRRRYVNLVIRWRRCLDFEYQPYL